MLGQLSANELRDVLNDDKIAVGQSLSAEEMCRLLVRHFSRYTKADSKIDQKLINFSRS